MAVPRTSAVCLEFYGEDCAFFLNGAKPRPSFLQGCESGSFSGAVRCGRLGIVDKGYRLIEAERGVPIKAWTKGVAIDAEAEKQLCNVARLPFIYKWVAAMPDVHWSR